MHFDPRGWPSTPHLNGQPVFAPPELPEPLFEAEPIDPEYCIPVDLHPDFLAMLENDSIGGC